MSDIPSQTSNPADDEIDLGRLFGLLLDHKWLIIAITALFSIGGIVYALLATPIYSADALVQVENKAGMANPLEDVRAMLGDEPSADAQLGILRSRLVLGRAVDQERLDLIVAPKRFPVIGDFLVRRGVERPGFAKSGFAESSVWANEAINIGDFQVDAPWQGKAFTIVTGEANRYSLRLEDETLGEGRIGQNAAFLNGQVQLRVAEIQAAPGAEFTLTQRSRLEAINELRSRFSVGQQGKDSGLLNLSLTGPDPQHAQRALNAISEVYLTQNIQRQSAEAEQSLNFLEGQEPEIREQLRAAEDALNAYRIERDSVDLSLETQSILERLVNLEAQLSELEFTESEVSRRFSPGHPTYSALLENKQQLINERERLNESIDNLPETQQQVLRRTRDVELNQEIYLQLRNKIQEMKIAKASTVGNVRILDEAVVQPGPVEPKKPLIVVLATLLGGMLAVGLVLLRGLFNRGVESPEQIEEIGLPVYATVPLSNVQQTLIKRIKRRSDKRSSSISTGVLADLDPTDTSVEALRSLRTSLHFAMMEAGNNRLMIAGPSPNIGKSFISINLAAVCAQAGQKVLVVDADMRKGHVHHAFGAQSEGGLSELLSGKATLDEVIREGNKQGLSYIARGSAPPNPSELLLNQRFSEFLEEASQRFDLVIIDTPPILAVTDAAVVGKQCGTTLMVLRFQLNPIKELQIAQRRLETAGVTAKGAILNAMERKAATSYGYGYYNYAYK
ncbi:polysaccharide biosynthesis tyrosine autokinase [Halomonas sp. ZH2S]|uniref:Polysaccharide biosynthesis tyrosine autokinase n=1 Tax=Vreelandella zhuhanensis TaxID=2684210 RepID=A0A7X3KR36_9GAMM|nr:polysaccharide biosynthesis tyrosine autokinase [Halomonas zhuhanensis]MWJ28483.1 polysaccharide biosynthesis tyrosine autokinase [Halomonas zhuhanensis]